MTRDIGSSPPSSSSFSRKGRKPGGPRAEGSRLLTGRTLLNKFHVNRLTNIVSITDFYLDVTSFSSSLQVQRLLNSVVDLGVSMCAT